MTYQINGPQNQQDLQKGKSGNLSCQKEPKEKWGLNTTQYPGSASGTHKGHEVKI